MTDDRAYRPEFDERLLAMGQEGKSWAEMAVGLGLNLPQVEAMIRDEPHFAAAAELADQAAWDWWWNLGAALALDPARARRQERLWNAVMRQRYGARALNTGERPPHAGR